MKQIGIIENGTQVEWRTDERGRVAVASKVNETGNWAWRTAAGYMGVSSKETLIIDVHIALGWLATPPVMPLAGGVQ